MLIKLLPHKCVVLLFLIFSMTFMLELSASQMDTYKEVITQNDKNKFTFPDRKSLHKLNSEGLKSHAHRAWFDIYVNTLAKKAYVKKLSLFPVGSILLKPLYSDQARSKTAKLTIMIKMEKGYDTKNADWWYGVYDKTGMEVYNQGKIKSCIKCHRKVKETDYVFSENTMKSIEEFDNW